MSCSKLVGLDINTSSSSCGDDGCGAVMDRRSLLVCTANDDEVVDTFAAVATDATDATDDNDEDISLFCNFCDFDDVLALFLFERCRVTRL